MLRRRAEPGAYVIGGLGATVPAVRALGWMPITSVFLFVSLHGCESETKPAPKPDAAEDGSNVAKPEQAPADSPSGDDEKAPAESLAQWSFDDGQPPAMPQGFRALETNGEAHPATWGLAKDDNAPSGGQAFGVLASENVGQTYNVALRDDFQAADVDLAVAVKPVSGKEDQGGGVVFRAQGATDYYIARWNPLETNIRFYVVKNQQRSAFGAADIELDPERWHTLRVLAEGSRMELFMDDQSVLVAEDTTHTKAGAVGLWTKADAATLFDDLTAQRL